MSLTGRQAKAAPAWYNGLKTLGQSCMMWLVFLGAGPFVVCTVETWLGLPRFRFPFWLAALLFLAGGVIANVSAYYLVKIGRGTPLPVDATNELVVAGPYRWIRNPMAFASLFQGFAIGLALGSPLTLVYIYVGGLMWNYLARPWEELDLERKFGESYCRYKREVKCWVPRLRPYH